jgi:ABC transport system ATP-binding/permease protein
VVPVLVVRNGPQAGASRPLDDVLVVGRSQRADLVLADEAVSREHARLSPEGMTVVVEDLDSANGTWVDGERIDSPCRVEEGTVILVGDTELVVSMESGEDALTPSEPTVIRPAEDSGVTRS